MEHARESQLRVNRVVTGIPDVAAGNAAREICISISFASPNSSYDVTRMFTLSNVCLYRCTSNENI